MSKINYFRTTFVTLITCLAALLFIPLAAVVAAQQKVKGKNYMRRIAFILYHTGETMALMPTMLKMAGKPDKYEICIIPVGQAALGSLPGLFIGV